MNCASVFKKVKSQRNILPSRRSVRIRNMLMKSSLERANREGGILPIRRSLRIWNRGVNVTLKWDELGLEGNALTDRRVGGRRIRNKNLHSVVKRGKMTNKKMIAPVKQDEFLPHELIIQILRFLPVKCLLKFKCVCKAWSSLIKERYFIAKHMSTSKIEYVYCSSRNLDPGEEIFFVLHILNGLLLTKSSRNNKFYIKNPATRQTLHLPEPLEEHVSMKIFYLGTTDIYKLAYLYYNKSENSVGCQVLTLGDELIWRNLEIPCLSGLEGDKLTEDNCVAVANMFCIIKHDYHEILCIDMESESCATVKIPGELISGTPENFELLDWDDKLSITEIVEKAGDWTVKVWVLEDLKNKKWAGKRIDIPLTFMKSYPTSVELSLSYFEDGWLWLYVGTEHVCYHIDSRRTIATPLGDGFSFYPSLVGLKGMTAEEKFLSSD